MSTLPTLNNQANNDDTNKLVKHLIYDSQGLRTVLDGIETKAIVVGWSADTINSVMQSIYGTTATPRVYSLAHSLLANLEALPVVRIERSEGIPPTSDTANAVPSVDTPVFHDYIRELFTNMAKQRVLREFIAHLDSQAAKAVEAVRATSQHQIQQLTQDRDSWKARAEAAEALIAQNKPTGPQTPEDFNICVAVQPTGTYICVRDGEQVLHEQQYPLTTAKPVQEMSPGVMRALAEARTLAMNKAASARIPECGDFGYIAQSLDWVLNVWAGKTQDELSNKRIEQRVTYLEKLVHAYGPKSLQYDMEHPNDGLNSSNSAEVLQTQRGHKAQVGSSYPITMFGVKNLVSKVINAQVSGSADHAGIVQAIVDELTPYLAGSRN